VSIYASESKSVPWKWLIVFLILLILALLFMNREKFTGSRPAQRETQSPAAGSDSLSSGPLRKTDALAESSGASVPSPTGIPASDDWYTKVAFHGLVLNETNRSPVQGANVSVYACASPASTVEKLTGTRGEFEVIAPPGYRYEVKVEADGFRAYRENSFVITRPYYQMEILLTPKLLLRGRVLDDENAGIPDAVVRLVSQAGGPMSSATTDSKGAFAFSNVPRKGWFIIEARHAGFETSGMVRGSLPADNEITVRMTPAGSSGSVVGGVTDKMQKPVPGAQVELYETSDGKLVAAIQTDRQGAYRFSRVREGNYRVRCTTEIYTDTSANPAEVKVVANREARADFSIDPGLVLNGIVLNQKDEPVPDAEVIYSQTADKNASAGGQDTRSKLRQPMRLADTDKEGRFRITGLIGAQGILSVHHPDYVSLTTRLRPSNQEQKVILDSGAVLRGTVSDSRGAAVERFNLTLRATSGRYTIYRSFITTDGHFEIHGLAIDSYQIMLRGADRGGFSGAMELQGSTEIYILLDSVLGGRGQSTLHILKSK
jgi:protocatechuate 3,4-dioxygenase beta subunit